MSNRVISLAILITILVPLTISAQITIQNPLGSQNMQLWELIDKIINLIFTLSLLIVPIVILIAAFFFITSMGDIEKVTKAKKMLLWALIGFIVILAAKGLIALLGTVFGINTQYN